jgi:hypothetical protein
VQSLHDNDCSDCTALLLLHCPTTARRRVVLFSIDKTPETT